MSPGGEGPGLLRSFDWNRTVWWGWCVRSSSESMVSVNVKINVYEVHFTEMTGVGDESYVKEGKYKVFRFFAWIVGSCLFLRRSVAWTRNGLCLECG